MRFSLSGTTDKKGKIKDEGNVKMLVIKLNGTMSAD